MKTGTKHNPQKLGRMKEAFRMSELKKEEQRVTRARLIRQIRLDAYGARIQEWGRRQDIRRFGRGARNQGSRA